MVEVMGLGLSLLPKTDRRVTSKTNTHKDPNYAEFDPVIAPYYSFSVGAGVISIQISNAVHNKTLNT